MTAALMPRCSAAASARPGRERAVAVAAGDVRGAAAHEVAVDDVVVHDQRGVQQLERGADVGGRLEVGAAERLVRGEHHARAEPLAPDRVRLELVPELRRTRRPGRAARFLARLKKRPSTASTCVCRSWPAEPGDAAGRQHPLRQTTGQHVAAPRPTPGRSSELVVLVVRRRARRSAPPTRRTIHDGDTPLHLAFSCHVFRADGRVLVTRRALGKRTFPGVWTNSFCGHPAPGETIEDAVRRRGAARTRARRSATLEPVLPDFRYRAVDASGIVENEICPVFRTVVDADPQPAADEVAEWAWVDPDAPARGRRGGAVRVQPVARAAARRVDASFGRCVTQARVTGV